MNQRTTWSRNW